MKSIIFVFALIAAASCDVSEIVQGDGWYKDATGYHYTEPQTRFSEEVAPVEEQVVVEEPAPVDAVPEEPAPVAAPVEPEVELQDPYVEVVEVVEVPENNLREYLPPKVGDAKRKRQIPVRRQVRKVYRRFVRRH